LVRALAYVGGLTALSIAAAQFFQSPPLTNDIKPVHRSDWIEIEKPFPAFALSIPEAAGQPSTYAIRRHADGNGRKDILTLGEADAPTPFLQVEIYRPGSEAPSPGGVVGAITDSADVLKPIAVTALPEPLPSKFGMLSVVSFETSIGTARQCLGFVRAYDDPNLRLSGWFCQSGSLVPHSMLACALDRLTLLAAGSDPKVGALFAQAELNRSFCGQREPLMASTPKYRGLWQASSARGEPRRQGR
jgi:hypothetical protein